MIPVPLSVKPASPVSLCSKASNKPVNNQVYTIHMRPIPLTTTRLTLVPVTLESCYAELKGPESLSTVIKAVVPGSWPPPLLDEETIHEFISMLSGTDHVLLCAWYWVLPAKQSGTEGVLIGSGGLFAHEEQKYEVGYSVLSEYQNNGYATEAVQGIVDFFFGSTLFPAVYATTYPALIPSVRVLEKCGFRMEGPGREEGTIRFVIDKR